MRTQMIRFQDRQTLCVFPDQPSNLEHSISELGLELGRPVLVLIGGEFDEQQADAIRRAILHVCEVAEEQNGIVICGGTDMGVMAEMGQIRSQKGYKFPLVGVAPEAMVTWPAGPHSGKFLGWGEKRWQLEPHYTHFILVPGSQFGEESSWIVDTATLLSRERRSVTVLINGGEVSRKDIELSLKKGRPVIALSRTGRLADELASDPERDKLITVIPANAEQRILNAIRAALSINEQKPVAPSADPRNVVQDQVNSIKEH